jgi:hypothetical protein
MVRTSMVLYGIIIGGIYKVLFWAFCQLADVNVLEILVRQIAAAPNLALQYKAALLCLVYGLEKPPSSLTISLFQR